MDFHVFKIVAKVAFDIVGLKSGQQETNGKAQNRG